VQTKRIPDPNIWVIYTAILLLGIAYGISIAVLAIHLKAHGLPELAMGGLAASFALGIASLSVPAGLAVRRFGPKATFAVALIGYACCVSAFPLFGSIATLTIARFFDGAFSALIWVSAETALLSRSNESNKAYVMSLYAVSIGIGYVVGPLTAAVVVPLAGTAATFVCAGVLAAASAFVVLTRFRVGDPGESAHDKEIEAEETASSKTSALAIIWSTKTSCFGTFAYGYFQASVVLFLPLFLIASKGVPKERTILVTAFFAAGMLAASIFVGKLGDRYGHLLVMRSLAAVGGCMVASFVLLDSFPAMCAAVFVAGCTLASISPVSLALQGAIVPRRDLGRANGLYNAAYAAGMLIGPPVSSVIFTRLGGGAMLLQLAGIWAAFVVFTLVYASDDPGHRAPAVERRA